MRTRRALRVLLLGMAICLPSSVRVSAQTFPLQSYTTRDGLPSNNVTALLQDSRGFLWIGTDNGLSVFNGATFKTIGMADGLPNSYVTCIQESRRSPGTFWVGTIAGGLVPVDAITPGYAYWVKAEGPGFFVLGGATGGRSTVPAATQDVKQERKKPGAAMPAPPVPQR